ncbi:MAG: flagellar basal body-associated FliL family protein [Treponema sp.]|jgi:flagellar FliL protein|nr:flagellar basal body-associated FliL family protein [Treponema sp.]
MSDSDDLDIDGSEVPGADGSPKKISGLAALLPNILKFVAIGLGVLIFIVTVAVITYNIMNKGGRSRTNAVDPTSPYVGRRPDYSMFTLIGPVTTKTKDTANYSVTVDLIIGYDTNDNAAQTELTSRQYELRDFVRNYFTGKYAAELQPENEARLKQEIREILNTRLLNTAKARIILFNKLDVMEVY